MGEHELHQKISLPERVTEKHLSQIIELIKKRNNLGRDIEFDVLRERLMRCHFIAYTVSDEDDIVCVAILKSPMLDYKRKVFEAARIPWPCDYFKELGYIATKRDFEGQGICKRLLHYLMKEVNPDKVFATTRSPAMINILKQIGFIGNGEPFERADNPDPIVLMTYNGDKS